MSNKQALVVGCSLSAGYGMPGGTQNPRVWSNQLLSKLGYQVHNHSRTGAANPWIFHQTLKCMQQLNPDLVLVQWTYLARLNWRVGLELYDTWSMLAEPGHDINLVAHETIPASWLSDIGNRLQMITNDHSHILQLVQYVNVLTQLAQARKCQIVFVNGAVGWPDNFFTPIEFDLPSQLPEYVQDLLSVAKRSDIETKHLYNMIYSEYTDAGGIHPLNWLNLYSSLNQCKIDTIAPGDQHPGLLSQDHYCQLFTPHLQTLL